MADDAKTLSPEEKLLRVIQGKPRKAPESRPETSPSPAEPSTAVPASASAPSPKTPPAAVTPPAPIVPPEKDVPGAGAGSKLRTKPRQPDAKPPPAEGPVKAKVAPGKGADSERGGGGEAKPGRVVAEPFLKEASTNGGSLKAVNRILSALVTIIVIAVVADIGLSLRVTADARPVVPRIEHVVRPGDSGFVLPPAEALLKSFRDRPFFPGVVTNSVPPPIRTGGVAPYVQNIVLLGISWITGNPSDQTAIFVDNKTGKMHFLKSGGTMVFEGGECRVKEIQSDRVVLSDGTREYILQEQPANRQSNL